MEEKVINIIPEILENSVSVERENVIINKSGTSNYDDLTNKPQINNVELVGNKTLEELGIKQTYTANDIAFSDGETFQQKYDNGELKGEKGDTGEQGIQGIQGEKGQDGFSPVVTTTSIENGTQVSITDATGSKTFDVMNGTNGTNGVDGHTPIKGADYFTEEDKQELVQDVLDALPNAEEVEF